MSADDFFSALRELAHMSKVPQFYTAHLPEYQKSAIDTDFLISVASHSEQINVFVQNIIDAGHSNGYNVLRDQVKTYQDNFTGTKLITSYPTGFHLSEHPKLEAFSKDKDLSACKLKEFTAHELEIECDLQRRVFESLPNKAATHKLHMTFEAVDTEELKNLGITVDGT